MKYRIGAILLALLLLTPAIAPASAPDPAGLDLFEKKIRPTLVDHCYKCHGADAARAGKLKGELLLDSREGIAKGGKNGPVIVPGKPGQSRLIEAIGYANEDLQMPPKDRLPADTVADFEKWVSLGAPDPRTGPATTVAVKSGIDIDAGKRFWSFQPLQVVEPPRVIDAAWARTPVDRFILAALDQKGLRPNPPAGREKLIRRACLDLVGLPPTPAEVAAFVNDAAPDAYEKLLDRLLASPRHGERWARHWLDVARFGESDGFEQDFDRPTAFQYRDFVIRALNQDMPFNQFVQWQIAGDELAPGDWQALAATGFLTAGVFPTQITEKEFESTRYNQLDDMVSTLGNAMLGLTIGCARCHDHKYDPIPTADYYRLTAAFATAVPSDVELDLTTPAERERRQADWKNRLAAAREKVDAFEKDELDARFNALIAKVSRAPDTAVGEWTVLSFDSIKAAHGTSFVAQPDGSLLKSGTTPPQDTITFTATVQSEQIRAIRLEALTEKTLPRNGPGAAGNGNFSLSEIEVSAAPADGSAPSKPVKIISAIATHQQNKGDLSVASSFDGNPATGWAVDGGGIGKPQAAIFNLENPIAFDGGTIVTITLRFTHPNPQHLIGRPRFSITSLANPTNFKGTEGPDAAIVRTLQQLSAGQAVSPASRANARRWFASTLPDYQKLRNDAEKLQSDGPVKNLTKLRVTTEGLPPVKNLSDGRGYPHFYKTVYQLRRGDPNNKLEPATPSYLHVLMRGGNGESRWQQPPPPDARTSHRRAALARWMTDTDNGAGHLLARVIVNRLWQHHFGRGIVATPNDFGAQGERPTHPELLDWLANDLIAHGWQLKRLHKLMMTSAVYTQSADTSADRTAIDPQNLYLWRWQPRRLEAEPIRDSLLAVSGLLDETMYGPGTLDQSMRRRSVYFHIKRSQLIPMMMVLDWPEPLGSVGARPVTTVAPQALLFMNSPQARQYAEGLAGRIASESTANSVTNAYRIALGRPPAPHESAMAASFIEKQSAAYRASGHGNPQAAALADFCQAILSANEFVYVE